MSDVMKALLVQQTEDLARNDPYVSQFLTSPVKVLVLGETMDIAASSYKAARRLSVILFFVGIALLAFAAFLGYTRNNETLSLIFGGLGIANLIALLLYRPIERIQSGVDTLIKSQIACLSFLAQYEAVARTLAKMSQLPLNETNCDEQLKLASYLKDSASCLIADLSQAIPSKTLSKREKTESKSRE
jgi:hypothetical protein